MMVLVRIPYLAWEEAVDVARIVGVPWFWGRSHNRAPAHPMIDLLELDEWTRFRVGWALVAGYAALAAAGYPLWRLKDEREDVYA